MEHQALNRRQLLATAGVAAAATSTSTLLAEEKRVSANSTDPITGTIENIRVYTSRNVIRTDDSGTSQERIRLDSTGSRFIADHTFHIFGMPYNWHTRPIRRSHVWLLRTLSIGNSESLVTAISVPSGGF